MTDKELRGRIVVLEVFCMSTLGIIFALTSGTDPGHRNGYRDLGRTTGGS